MYNKDIACANRSARSFFYVKGTFQMTVAQRIGLPPLMGSITSHSFIVVLIICWAITPSMMIIIGFFGESRIIPMSPRDQFLSFFPGDLILGGGVACLIAAAHGLPNGHRWYSSPILHLVVSSISMVAAYYLTKAEWKTGAYPKRAILSPTKIYHNFFLYGVYGYLAGVTLLADVAGLGWHEIFVGRWLTFAVVLIGTWLIIVVTEGMIFGTEGMARKARHAHVSNWMPFPLVSVAFAIKQVLLERRK